LSHSICPFLWWVFSTRVSELFAWSWLQIAILLMSASQAAKITGESHHYYLLCFMHSGQSLGSHKSGLIVSLQQWDCTPEKSWGCFHRLKAKQSFGYKMNPGFCSLDKWVMLL
jgi:hypothetical protein